MVELTLLALSMKELDLKTGLQSQVLSLQGLMGYLEDRHELGANEYFYCQAKLRDVLDQLKRLERMTGADHSSSTRSA